MNYKSALLRISKNYFIIFQGISSFVSVQIFLFMQVLTSSHNLRWCYEQKVSLYQLVYDVYI